VSRFVSEKLSATQVLDGFDSGVPALDTWLVRSAIHAQSMRTAQTFVWHTDDRVVAYFSLAAHLVVRSAVPPRIGRGSPDAIPAILLARLALDRRLHGQGLGGELLWDAMARACRASEIAAARLIIVDAYDERAAAFYQRYGFVPIPGNASRLVQKVSDVAAALTTTDR
jgi:GNAT superfamily N-acetyltransferase